MSVTFTPEFIAEQRDLIVKSLPWVFRQKTEGNFEIRTGPTSDDWLVAASLAFDEAKYVKAAANNYPAALDTIEGLLDENKQLRDTLADNEAYCAPLVMDNDALTKQNTGLKEKAAELQAEIEYLRNFLTNSGFSKCPECGGYYAQDSVCEECGYDPTAEE